MASLAGELHIVGLATYVASKHAVLAFTDSARLEYRPYGVHFSAVLPTFVNTELVSGTPGMKGFRNAEPTEIADAIVGLVAHPKPRVRVTKAAGAMVVSQKFWPRRLAEDSTGSWAANTSSPKTSTSKTPRLRGPRPRRGAGHVKRSSPASRTIGLMSPETATAATPAILSDDELALIDSYWRAANYLSVGQIYLLDNPMLAEPLAAEHVKPRLLGHWGTTPGLNLLYVHLNRIIRNRDANVIYITGPGHGGPGLVANAYLEGTYSEVYTGVEEDTEGLRKLFRQFSFPGGIPQRRGPDAGVDP